MDALPNLDISSFYEEIKKEILHFGETCYEEGTIIMGDELHVKLRRLLTNFPENGELLMIIEKTGLVRMMIRNIAERQYYLWYTYDLATCKLKMSDEYENINKALNYDFDFNNPFIPCMGFYGDTAFYALMQSDRMFMDKYKYKFDYKIKLFDGQCMYYIHFVDPCVLCVPKLEPIQKFKKFKNSD